jgi:hypothetical protein
MRSNFKINTASKINMDNKLHIPNNTILNNNSETYNTRIFDRNVLNSKILSSSNKNPVYFSEQHKKNRKDAEVIFQKRFEQFNNLQQGGKFGYVDFSDKQQENFKTDKTYKFSGNYSKYLDGSDPIHSSFMQTKEDNS